MYLRLLIFFVGVSIAGCTATAGSDGSKTIKSGSVTFEELERRDTPNDYLVCPEGFCKKAEPDRLSPVIPVPAKDLRARVDALLASAPRTTIVSADDRHIVAEQRSLIFRFPDTIDIAIVPVDTESSTVAIYSRSRYGYSDLGANERRVSAWLADLTGSER